MTKQRIRRMAAAAAGITLGSIILLASYGQWSCPVRAIAGIPCACCGITTAFWLLLRLDAAGAWRANPLIFFLIPWCLWAAALYVRDGSILVKNHRIWLILALALLVMGAGRLTSAILF